MTPNRFKASLARVSEWSQRRMSGGRWSRFVGGAVYGGLIGAGLMLLGIAPRMADVTGFDGLSVRGASFALLYVLAFAAGGGVVGFLWKLTTNFFGAILAGVLGMLVVSSASILMTGFEEVLPPLPQMVAAAALYSGILGSIAGILIWLSRRPRKLSPRIEKALDRLLADAGAARENLTDEQLDMLRNVCRCREIAKWNLALMAPLAAFMIYAGLSYIPEKVVSGFSSWAPTKVIVIDKAADKKVTIGGDEESLQTWTKLIMVLGGMAGLVVVMGAFLLGQAIVSAFTLWGTDRLVRFLKGSRKSACPGPG